MAELNDYLGGCGEDEEDNSNGSGAASRWIIDSNLRWNDTFVLSGTAVSLTRRVWRLTCNPGNSVAADRSCAAEVSQDVVATVGLWADGGVGLAPGRAGKPSIILELKLEEGEGLRLFVVCWVW